jgi:hypothetical protein
VLDVQALATLVYRTSGGSGDGGGAISTGSVTSGKSSIAGLNRLCQVQLGTSIDKTMQCSDWAHRPLSQRQLQYAALDARALLQLYDSLLQQLRDRERQQQQQQQQQEGGDYNPKYPHPGGNSNPQQQLLDTEQHEQEQQHEQSVDSRRTSDGDGDGDGDGQLLKTKARKKMEMERGWNMNKTKRRRLLATPEGLVRSVVAGYVVDTVALIDLQQQQQQQQPKYGAMDDEEVAMATVPAAVLPLRSLPMRQVPFRTAPLLRRK